MIASDLSLEMPLVDLGSLAETVREEEAQRLLQDEARKPFDLSQDPLIRGLLLRLKDEEHILLITMDHWMSLLFPTENRTIEDFARLSARLRAAMGPHVVDILRHDLSVVLDFPANTVNWRSWMRSLITEAGVAHELHVLDVRDTICKERLRCRNACLN